jgi:type IV secretory pathway TrbL component
MTLLASAGVLARARMATRTARLRSGDADAGVKRKSELNRVPRRASAAASRGSETAGVKAPTGRAFIAALGREALLR